MYLSEIRIENFRQFGSGAKVGLVPFGRGVTALIGENDSGKTSVIDAIRYALHTRDAEYLKVVPEDFHVDSTGHEATYISIRCQLSALSPAEQGSFAEYLTFESGVTVMYLNWRARRLSESPGNRRWVDVSITSGTSGEGPTVDSGARQLLAAAYLRPLRDAAREMSPGRGSRLSQILGSFPEISAGERFDPTSPPETPEKAGALNLAGMTDYLRHLVNQHSGINAAQTSVNADFLTELTLAGSGMSGQINFTQGGSESSRLRQILERLELVLRDEHGANGRGPYGLGSNNLLFMACELLLLGKEDEGLPLLLVEEPEAHLHPQRQLRLMEFLEKVSKQSTDDPAIRPVQTIVTTHSPNLASKVPLENIVLMHGNRAFSLAPTETLLEPSDYRFLARFLDATKANLFFAQGLLIVEGHAEAILLPTIAKLVGMDLTKHGVSIVNVGSTGFRRYAKIFQRRDEASPQLRIPVACLADMDVMPDCAPDILGLVTKLKDPKGTSTTRRWKIKSDFQGDGLVSRKENLKSGDGQNIRTFVADEWTFEYALAHAGLAEMVLMAARLAISDDKLNQERTDPEIVKQAARDEYIRMEASGEDQDRVCSRIYSLFGSGSNKASKAIAAQYMAELLTEAVESGKTTPEDLKQNLPDYVRDALAYVTAPLPAEVKTAEKVAAP
jgi:putative ATP-dependent endonuclease of OLD family